MASQSIVSAIQLAAVEKRQQRSFPLGFNRLQLLPEEDLNPVGGPDGDPGAKEVGIFRPDGTGQGKRCRDYRPVVLVPVVNSLAGLRFEKRIEVGSHRL